MELLNGGVTVKKLLKVLMILLLVAVLAFVGLVAFLTVTEYKPKDVEPIPVTGSGSGPVPAENLRILSWNIGYAGLGAAEDFFMDGGTRTRPDSPETVNTYLDGIRQSITETRPADLILLQEVDSNSARSYRIDETEVLSGSCSAYALNYSSPFVPYPFPPLGKVKCGLLTTTGYEIREAERVSLPCPFSWPMRTANLKRCLLVSRLPVQGSEKELVLVNLHLEAYDSGEGKIAQTRQLMDILQEEYQNGNYVIAGGDFNQLFPDSLQRWPNNHPDLWKPGILETESLPPDFQYVYDLTVPTCRLLNQPYDPADTANTQYYVIDGFIVSPNVTVDTVETLDFGFQNSDHNPVYITVSLK
jgi:endonuclease/exonuclease/phosphatase family metal-dependent hydrolase